MAKINDNYSSNWISRSREDQKLKHMVTDQFRYKSSLLINLGVENRDKVKRNEILLDRLIV
jgi:hypothetical protein